MLSTISYLKNLASDKQVASVTPTSPFGVRRVCRDMDFQKARTIVEYGPGGGVFVEYLLRKMHPQAQLIAIERNAGFAKKLKETIQDPRFQIFCDSAENVMPILAAANADCADYIISGIPFSLFPLPLKSKILDNTNQALSPEGSFLVYQFYPSFGDPKTDIKACLARHLRLVRKEVELMNVPPLRIYEAKKRTHRGH